MEQEWRAGMLLFFFGGAGNKSVKCVVMDVMVHCDEASSFSCRWRNPPASVPHLWGRSRLLRCLLLAGLLPLLGSYGPCPVLCLSSRPLSVVFGPPLLHKGFKVVVFKRRIWFPVECITGMGIVNEIQWLAPLKCCSIQVEDAKVSQEEAHTSSPNTQDKMSLSGYFTLKMI